MTKKQEIEILRKTAEQLGDDSYCGPWLASVVAEVEQIIRSDYAPVIAIAESVEKARRVIDAACDEASGIVEVAQADAAKIMDRAERYKSEVEGSLRLALRNLNAV